MRGIEERPEQEAMRCHSEKRACPRRGNPTAVETVLSRRQIERGGKAFWHAEQSDRHPARCWDSRVAREPLLKVETIMRAVHETGAQARELGWQRAPALPAPLPVAAGADACTSVDGADGSSLSRAGAQTR